MSNIDELKYCMDQKYWENIECSDDVIEYAGDNLNELRSDLEATKAEVEQYKQHAKEEMARCREYMNELEEARVERDEYYNKWLIVEQDKEALKAEVERLTEAIKTHQSVESPTHLDDGNLYAVIWKAQQGGER